MTIRIIASRHTAFYSPLISAMAVGFLEKQGLAFTYDVLAPGETAAGMIRDGRADVVQSAPSTNWAMMEKGATGFPIHFALINQRDGFFLVSRSPDASFSWKDLEGRRLVADHGSQPLAMLHYAAHYNGVEWNKILLVDAGAPEKMIAAFRKDEGDFIHLQGPAPQLLEEEGIGKAVVSVGASMPANAFSTLSASREFIGTPEFNSFVKAFAEGKKWVQTASAQEIAVREASYFPGIGERVLEAAIAHYKSIGSWDGGIGIRRDLYEQSLTVFEYSGRIKQRQPYDAVCIQIS